MISGIGFCDSESIAQEMTAVSTGIVAQIILVIRLGGVPLRCRFDGGRNSAFPTSRRVDARSHTLRSGFLLWCLGEDRRAILRTDVVPLPVERGRVVQLEEPPLEQLLVAEYCRVEHHTNSFSVPRFAIVRVVV